MSDVAWAFVVASVLIMLAGFVAVRAWQATRSSVLWMRPPGNAIAHAFTRDELDSALIEVQPLANCGRWPRAELVGDADAEQCMACMRAIERLEHQHK